MQSVLCFCSYAVDKLIKYYKTKETLRDIQQCEVCSENVTEDLISRCVGQELLRKWFLSLIQILEDPRFLSRLMLVQFGAKAELETTDRGQV